MNSQFSLSPTFPPFVFSPKSVLSCRWKYTICRRRPKGLPAIYRVRVLAPAQLCHNTSLTLHSDLLYCMHRGVKDPRPPSTRCVMQREKCFPLYDYPCKEPPIMTRYLPLQRKDSPQRKKIHLPSSSAQKRSHIPSINNTLPSSPVFNLRRQPFRRRCTIQCTTTTCYLPYLSTRPSHVP